MTSDEDELACDGELRHARHALQQLGLLEATGEFRQGQPVYRVTAFSRALSEKHPNEDDFWAAVEVLARQIGN